MTSEGAGDRANEQGRFAARAFVAHWERETGQRLSPIVADRMLFSYEIGYLRGRGNFSRAVTLFFANQATDLEETGDQAQSAAKEFLARWARETGEVLSAVVTDRMLFAFEMGYLRGRSDAGHDALQMLDEKKGSDADADAKRQSQLQGGSAVDVAHETFQGLNEKKGSDADADSK